MDQPLDGDLDRWLAATTVQPVTVPWQLAPLLSAVKDARIDTLVHNDPLAETAAERQAAVLILIATDSADGPDVLLQQRAPTLRDHAGQVSFPGGSREAADLSPIATAIREAVEETGLDPGGVAPLALLPRLHIPPSGFDVTPVIAHWRTPSAVRAIDRAETARVMRIPFTCLSDPAHRRLIRTRTGWLGSAFVVDGAVVWGFTGEIVAALLALGGWDRAWDDAEPIDLEQAMAEASASTD